MRAREIIFISLIALGAGMLYSPMHELLKNAARSEYYSHIILIPFVSGALIYWNRNNLFTDVRYSVKNGSFLICLGILIYLIGFSHKNSLSQNDFTAVLTLGVIIFWMGAFLLSYGQKSFRLALFPLLFLFFMVPIPFLILDRVIYFLQLGSAEITYLLFQLLDIPVARSGFVFDLPKVSIEVAKQCSCIRSSLALFITSILAAHFFLETGWKKVIFVLSIIPITIFKNGVRIVTLSLLAIYVDERFLTGGFLHRSGGIVFYIPALVLLGAILLALKKTEKKSKS